MFDNPGGWKAAAHSPAFKRTLRRSDGETLVRPPRGFPADHELIDDIKRKDFVATLGIEDAVVLGPRLRQAVADNFSALAPMMDYLCAALDLEF